MAEVMKFDEFKEHGSEAAVKAAGGYRQQGESSSHVQMDTFQDIFVF